MVSQTQTDLQNIQQAEAQLDDIEKQLTGLAGPRGLQRAACQTRANALKTLQRFPDAIVTLDQVIALSGKDGRLTPGALRDKAELLALDDAAAAAAVCRTLMQDFPRSLEVKFAWQFLIDQDLNAKRRNGIR